jgi:hypothetical protein
LVVGTFLNKNFIVTYQIFFVSFWVLQILF